MAGAEDLAEKRTEFLNKAAVKTAIAADPDLQKQVDQLVALAGMTPDPSVLAGYRAHFGGKLKVPSR